MLAVASLAACGLLLATALPDARAAGAAALMILFVVAFVSDIFLVGGPDWMRAVGALLPLAHVKTALLEAWLPEGPAIAWVSLAALAGWTIAASAATWLLLRARGAAWRGTREVSRAPRRAAGRATPLR